MTETALSGAPAALQTPLQQLLDMGGPVMLVLLALAAAGLITFFYLMLSGALFAPRLSRPLRTAVEGWQQQPGRHWPEQLAADSGWLAQANPLTGLALHAMQACLAHCDPAALREELARRSQQALQPFEAPLKIIEVIAALAPLLGLLGTVMGMMEAFSAMSASAGRAGATQLSGGIYEALTTTAAGLVIAIPFAALAAWVEFRLRRLNANINDTLVRIVNTPVPRHSSETRHPTGEPEPEARPASANHSPSRVAHAAG